MGKPTFDICKFKICLSGRRLDERIAQDLIGRWRIKRDAHFGFADIR